jgi:acyl-CoA thioesterase
MDSAPRAGYPARMSAPSFLDATQVTPSAAADGTRYAAHLTNDWNAPTFPCGGVVSALALRAMESALDEPHQALRSFATMFVSTVESGALTIDVERLRIGKRMSHLRADVRSAGRDQPGHLTTAAFGESRVGFDFTYRTPPEVGPPDDYPGLATPPPGVAAWRSSFFDNLDVRRVRSFASFESDWEGGRAEVIRWFRYRVSPRLPDGRLDPLALVAIADTMPPAIAQHHGPGFPLFHAPSVDLTMRILGDTDEEWILSHVIGHWAGDGYASADVILWDAKGRLLASGAQMMLIRLPEGAG